MGKRKSRRDDICRLRMEGALKEPYMPTSYAETVGTGTRAEVAEKEGPKKIDVNCGKGPKARMSEGLCAGGETRKGRGGGGQRSQHLTLLLVQEGDLPILKGGKR